MSDDDFEVQLAQEAADTTVADSTEDAIGKARTRTDPDGTVYEWDAEKGAWFPKIDEDFIANYQMNYGADVTTTTADTASNNSVPSVTDPNYYQYYYSHYASAGSSSSNTTTTDSEAYRQWYNYYYGAQDTDPKSKTEKSSEIPPAPADINSEEYYNWYYTYYGQSDTPSHAQQTTAGQSGATETTNGAVKTQQETNPSVDNKEKGKSKRKAPDPPSWFDVSEEKNTNVYVSGLPVDMTEDEFKELMNKCGLIMYDPITRKPKLKMYKDENGENKGDGRCCYIKPESVDLALQFLDGSDFRGHKIYVERAKFEMKGSFDPSKRRRKMTKQERKKFQEKQQKLFDWRPDKPVGARNKNDKVVILKNMFDFKIFEKDPTLVNKMRDKLKKECSVFGEVKKVVIYDRHPEGVVGVTFLSPEEADICIEGMNGRYYAQRVVTAATWDGKTKYVVQETDQEHQQRLSQWTDYLEGEEGTEKTAKAPGGEDTVDRMPRTEKSSIDTAQSETLPSTMARGIDTDCVDSTSEQKTTLKGGRVSESDTMGGDSEASQQASTTKRGESNNMDVVQNTDTEPDVKASSNTEVTSTQENT